jgi:hypothetical protein
VQLLAVSHWPVLVYYFNCLPPGCVLLPFCVQNQPSPRFGCNTRCSTTARLDSTQLHCTLLLPTPLDSTQLHCTTSATAHTCTAAGIRRMQCTAGTTQALHATTGQAGSCLGLFPSPTRSLRHANKNDTQTKVETNPQPHQDVMQTSKTQHSKTTGEEGEGCSRNTNTPKQIKAHPMEVHCTRQHV